MSLADVIKVKQRAADEYPEHKCSLGNDSWRNERLTDPMSEPAAPPGRPIGEFWSL